MDRASESGKSMKEGADLKNTESLGAERSFDSAERGLSILGGRVSPIVIG